MESTKETIFEVQQLAKIQLFLSLQKGTFHIKMLEQFESFNLLADQPSESWKCFKDANKKLRANLCNIFIYQIPIKPKQGVIFGVSIGVSFSISVSFGLI